MNRILLILSLCLATTSIRAAELAPAQTFVQPKILILPFALLAENDKQAWIGLAIRENLQAELGRLQLVEVVAAPQPAPGQQPLRLDALEAQPALDIGRAARADIVVFGTYQLVEPEIRVTGQALEAATGKNLGSLKVNGDTRDLLKLEDALSQHLVQVLVDRGWIPVPDGHVPVALADPAPIVEPAPVVEDYSRYDPPPVLDYTPQVWVESYSYRSPYWYPSVGWVYPAWAYPRVYTYAPYYCEPFIYPGWSFTTSFSFWWSRHHHHDYVRHHPRSGYARDIYRGYYYRNSPLQLADARADRLARFDLRRGTYYSDDRGSRFADRSSREVGRLGPRRDLSPATVRVTDTSVRPAAAKRIIVTPGSSDAVREIAARREADSRRTDTMRREATTRAPGMAREAPAAAARADARQEIDNRREVETPQARTVDQARLAEARRESPQRQANVEAQRITDARRKAEAAAQSQREADSRRQAAEAARAADAQRDAANREAQLRRAADARRETEARREAAQRQAAQQQAATAQREAAQREVQRQAAQRDAAQRDSARREAESRRQAESRSRETPVRQRASENRSPGGRSPAYEAPSRGGSSSRRR